MGTVTVKVVCVGGGRCILSLYLFYTFMVLFEAIQACFHHVGVIYALPVGNGSALHIRHSPLFLGAVDYKCTSDYPIRAGTACLTQNMRAATITLAATQGDV